MFGKRAFPEWIRWNRLVKDAELSKSVPKSTTIIEIQLKPPDLKTDSTLFSPRTETALSGADPAAARPLPAVADRCKSRARCHPKQLSERARLVAHSLCSLREEPEFDASMH